MQKPRVMVVRQMTRLRPFVMLTIGLAISVAVVRPGFAQFREMLPANVLAVRNNSGDELYFFVGSQDGWLRLSLKSGDEVELPRPIMIAVPTSPADGVETGAPQKSPAAMHAPFQRQDEYYYEGLYFIRELSGKQRWELCWSDSKKAWVVQMLGERLCQ